MNRIILTIVAALALTGTTDAAEKREIRLDTHQFQFSPEVVIDPKDGTVRLARSVLVADEAGSTDFRQTEALSDRVWARKDLSLLFVPDRSAVRSAELFVFGSPRQVEVNGNKLDKPERLASTGWSRVRVPTAFLVTWAEVNAKALHPGSAAPPLAQDDPTSQPDAGVKHQFLNEVVLSGGGSLLLEPRQKPGRSVKSPDGGRTWSNRQLGAQNSQTGEYLVRLRLASYPTYGWAQSPVFDLWADSKGSPARPGRVVRFHELRHALASQPPRTDVSVQLRVGTTPTPDEKNWQEWWHFGSDVRLADSAPRYRWAQLRFTFENRGPRGGATPRLPREIILAYDLALDADAGTDKVGIVPVPGAKPFACTSVSFVYQAPSPRLKLLRERYKLDEVIAPGKTEMEQLVLLRHWVRNQWHTAWQGGPASWMPPWDAHIILDCKDQPDCLTMCTHYAAVFTQCCLALGWTARHCILDHHCVSEVFVNQHNKWVMMDAGNSKERADVGLHFERGGLPLSALELHLAYHQKKTEGITVRFTPKALTEKIAHLCRPEPAQPARPAKKAKQPMATGPRPDAISLAELDTYPVCQINNYRRYAFPARNNYLDSLLPGELYQGWSSYFYDGYWWVGDSPDDPKLSPEYSKHLDPARPQDIDWSLNWTRIHLARTAKAGELQVDLETLTPNFARFEMQVDGKWKQTPARFSWTVRPGENALRIRSVNQFERPGIEASVQVKRSE